MKKTLLFLTLVFFLGFSVDATDYYLAANGNDGNNGTSQSTPWKSIDKLNAYFSNIKPGDRILFRRGDTFYGGIVVNKSGTAGSPITIGAYGSGEKPVITGFTTVNSWNNLGGNIWESSTAVSTLPYTNMVVVNGVNTAMGRWPNSTGPNTGYLTIKSTSGNTSLTSDQLTGSPNWTGASVVIRKERWGIERGTITGHSGGTLNYTDGNIYVAKSGYGFFIQNDPKTLDVNGEWFYNTSTRKIRIYSTSTPKEVKIASVENLVFASAKNYIIINDLAFEGSNSDAINCFNYGNYLTIRNCDIAFAGKTGIHSEMNYTTVENNNVSYVNYMGILAIQHDANIQYNNIKHVNMFEGMDQTISSAGIMTGSENAIIQYNRVDSCGYNAIIFHGRNTKVKNNFVNWFCFLKDDGGGISMGAKDRALGSIIDGNIVLNTNGAIAGAPGGSTDASGIFIDAYGTGISIINNTVANCVNIGIKLHGANNIVVKNNTVYNNGGLDWSKGGLELLSRSDYLIRNISINENIFFAKNADQYAFFGSPNPGTLNDLKFFGTASDNYYAKPIDPNSTILIGVTPYSVQGWQSYSGQDARSKGAPKTITDVKDLRFEYNATPDTKTIRLDGNYIDVKNVSYNGSIILAPYTSSVLIRNGAIQNQSPTATAGPDQTITLPSNTVSLNGLGTDSDGSIISYNWSKLSGPSGAIITKSTSASTNITDLIQGTYQFVFKVTDNVGATGMDTIQIIVKPAVINNMPVANAGSNQTIILPTNTTTLIGSGSVDGGTITSYNWTKLSGPSQGTIVNPIVASTSLTGLVEGNYVFQLKVTDNNGISNTSSLQIMVRSAENLLPAVLPSNLENGIDFKYYEGTGYSVVPDFSKLTPVKTGSVNNFDITVANRDNVFAFEFTGYIDIPTDGQYTFYTTSDDGSLLYIDNQLVVDNDGLHGPTEKSGTIGLKAGKHSIKVGFFEQNGTETLNVHYAGPGISKRAVPNSILYRTLPESLNGLNYSYYEGSGYNFIPDFSKILPVKTGIVSNFDISVANRVEIFAIEFKGYINIPANGQYTFYTTSDDGSMLYINNKLIVNNDGLHSALERSGSIYLTAGRHAISVGFFQQSLDKKLEVLYEGPGISKRSIPSTELFPDVLTYTRSGFGSEPLSSINPIRNQIIDNELPIGISVYPNPFINSINVILNGEGGEFRILVIDALGRVAITRNGSKREGYYQQTINVSFLQKGIYFLKVIQNNKSSVIKLEK